MKGTGQGWWGQANPTQIGLHDGIALLDAGEMTTSASATSRVGFRSDLLLQSPRVVFQ